jgi:hypothetical protein
MRTKEQIQELLTLVKFTDEALAKILGFMIGKGLKEEKEQMKVIIANDCDGEDWSFFYDWYNCAFEIKDLNEDKNACCKCPLCDMLNECLHIIDNEKDPEKVQKAKERYQFLMEAFKLDEH